MVLDATTTPAASSGPVASLVSFMQSAPARQSVAAAALLGTENVGGVEAYHTRMTFPDGSLVFSAFGVGAPNSPVSFIQITPKKPLTLDIWVGKSDTRILKIHTSPLEAQSAGTGLIFSYSTDAVFKNFDAVAALPPAPAATPLSQFWQNS